MLLLTQGNALQIPLADESVHCVVTSPPYWGLRSYSGEQSQIWGGDADCAHEWDIEEVPPAQTISDKTGLHKDGRKTPITEKYRETLNEYTPKNIERGNCIHCGAWYGELGLEPTPEEYVANMVAVFREVKRVLRADGTVFLNLGDSYFGSNQGRMADGTQVGGAKQMTNKGSVTIGSGVQHAKTYDTSGKAPGDYQEHGCLCGSLCDACRVAYRIGKSRNDNQHVPTLASLSPKSTRSRKEEQRDHPPTLDYRDLMNHNSNAILDPVHWPDHGDEQPPASQVSMLDESSQQQQDRSRQSDNSLACLLCGHSLVSDAQEYARKSGVPIEQPPHNQNIASDDALLEYRNQNRDKACEYCVSLRDIIPQRTIKPKDLVGIPWMLALALRDDGWWLRSDIIWAKPNPMPESVTDRPTKSHEYLFLLTKSARYFYDCDAVREPHDTAKTDPRRRVSWEEYEDSKVGRFFEPGQDLLKKGRMADKKEGFKYLGHPSGRNRRTVWHIATAPYSGAHFATYPPALVEPCIKAGTSERGVCPECGNPWERVISERNPPKEKLTKRNAPVDGMVRSGQRQDGVMYGSGQKMQEWLDANPKTTLGWRPTCDCVSHDPIPAVVFDPFAGSGTTLQVARALGRDAVGLDLSLEYLHLARKRLSLDALDAWTSGGKKDGKAVTDLPMFQEENT